MQKTTRRQAGHRNIPLGFPMRLLGFPQAPDRTQSVRSNTPDGVAFLLPAVADVQEVRGAFHAVRTVPEAT